MKQIVTYFTGTGNSLAVAKKLAEKLGAELIPMAQLVKSGTTIEADVLGIVVPVYMYRAPHIAMQLIDLLRSIPYVFAVATNGGGMGVVFEQIDKRLKKRGNRLALGVEIHMPDNYLPFGGAMALEKQNELFAVVDERIDFITENVNNRSFHIDSKTNWFARTILPGSFFWMGYTRVKTMDKSFKLTDSCSGCGICAKICPVDNITMNDKRPVWNGSCEQCFACIQWCPSESIEYGRLSKGKKRYHHPDISLKDMMIQAGK